MGYDVECTCGGYGAAIEYGGIPQHDLDCPIRTQEKARKITPRAPGGANGGEDTPEAPKPQETYKAKGGVSHGQRLKALAFDYMQEGEGVHATEALVYAFIDIVEKEDIDLDPLTRDFLRIAHFTLYE